VKISGVKGMNDILPAEVGAWQRIEDLCREHFDLYGYREVRTPVVEETRLFARSIGEATDIVGKEMYTFTDRKGKKQLSLRPEGTAGAVRAYIEHSVQAKDPVSKWWYAGPMYRYERVQAGRYRQFHQIGAEALGVAGPGMDAELLVMLDRLLRQALKIADVTLLLNSLGDRADRAAYVTRLKAHLADHLDTLCEDCKRRFEQNPLRTLDCKVPGCQPVLEAAPAIGDHLSDPARAHFETVTGLLSEMGVPFELKPRLVRGLDYYNRTAFEFVAGGLGAQNTVCAGGRYDDLVKTLGGPDVPAIGFAMGVERLLMLAADSLVAGPAGPEVFLVAVGDEAFGACFRLMDRLRAAGVAAEMDLRGGSLKSQMRRADKVQARYAAVIGETEIAEGAAKLKDLRGDGASGPFPFEGLAGAIRDPRND
jgi:histidyl-tRNA synthetase